MNQEPLGIFFHSFCHTSADHLLNSYYLTNSWIKRCSSAPPSVRHTTNVQSKPNAHACQATVPFTLGCLPDTHFPSLLFWQSPHPFIDTEDASYLLSLIPLQLGHGHVISPGQWELSSSRRGVSGKGSLLLFFAGCSCVCLELLLDVGAIPHREGEIFLVLRTAERN